MPQTRKLWKTSKEIVHGKKNAYVRIFLILHYPFLQKKQKLLQLHPKVIQAQMRILLRRLLHVHLLVTHENIIVITCLKPMTVLSPLYTFHSITFDISDGSSTATKLNGQSCSSQGYQMAVSQCECQNIATLLGLSETYAMPWDDSSCNEQKSYRCAFKEDKLYWNADCADNDQDMSDYENLCIRSGNNRKINETFLFSYFWSKPNLYHSRKFL